jgi:hypothetical protein
MSEIIGSFPYMASINGKILDAGIGVARLVREPTAAQLEKVASDFGYLYCIIAGSISHCVALGMAHITYRLSLGKYRKALEVTVDMFNAMALPYILLRETRPYLSFSYGMLVALSAVYDAISNVHSFFLEMINIDDTTLKSCSAYKGLVESLATSPLRSLYDFQDGINGYDLQINDILFKKEKLAIEARLQDQGEFGQKLFDNIYLPALTARYDILNNAITGTITEKAEASKFKPLARLDGLRSYDQCIETKVVLPSEEGAERYYCYNVERQVIDHIAVVGDNDLEVLERHNV